jgi:hypothetical protein
MGETTYWAFLDVDVQTNTSIITPAKCSDWMEAVHVPGKFEGMRADDSAGVGIVSPRQWCI